MIILHENGDFYARVFIANSMEQRMDEGQALSE